jgi:hypothetical protein
VRLNNRQRVDYKAGTFLPAFLFAVMSEKARRGRIAGWIFSPIFGYDRTHDRR